MLRLLLWQKLRVQRNEIVRGTWRKRIGWLAGLALGGVFIYLVFTTAVLIFDFLLNTQAQLVDGILAAGFSVLATFALFWGVGSVLSDLYLASDLELLLAAPVALRDIFWLKLIGAMWQSVVPALLPITMLAAYGVASGASAGYYVVVLLVLALLLALLAAVSMAIVMLLMRLMPARRAREIYSLLYVVFFAVLWLGWMLLSQGSGRTRELLNYGSELAATGSRLAVPPATWAASLTQAWVRGDMAGVAQNAGLLVILAAALIGLTYWLFERSFHRDWAAMHEVAARGVPAAGGAGRGAAHGARARDARGGLPFGMRLAAILPWPAADLAGKDWTILPRDLRQLSRLVMPAVVSLFYIYQVGWATPIPRSVPGLGFWVALLILPIVPLFFALALAAPSIGKEGSNFELLRVAPLPGSALLWGKVWMAAIPTAVMAMFVTLVVALNLGVEPLQLVLLLILACLLSGSISAIAVALGALVPNFRTVDYRRAAGPLASYGTLFGGVIIWAVAVATVGIIAIHLPAGSQALSQGLRGGLGRAILLLRLLESPWSLLVVLMLNGVVFFGFSLLWRYASHHVDTWQPGD